LRKYAFILLGKNYIPDEHNACFSGKSMDTYIFTVRSFQEAREKVLQLEKEGFGAIELCGAFGEQRARELVELTKRKIAIGYVTHDKSLDEVFDKFFS